MKAVYYLDYGEPWDVVSIKDEPLAEPGNGEVRVKIEAAPIHIADLKCMRGEPNFRMFPLPTVPGFEGVGRITAVGPGSPPWNKEDRVFLPLACGAWREEIVVSADAVWTAPEGDSAQLSLLPINPMTAELMLRDFGNLKAGDWVIQNAANSSCGLYLIALAKLKGIRTINVVRSNSNLELLKESGGDINLVDSTDLPERVKAATKESTIKLAIDAVAGTATTRLGACLSEGGTVLNYGMLSGQPCMLPPDMVFLHDIRLRGFYTARQLSIRSKNEINCIYKELASLISNGSLKARIAGVFSLSEAAEACRLADKVGDERPGKVIFLMDK